MKKILLNIMYPIIVIIVILLMWFIASKTANTNIILPTPIKSLKELFKYFKSSSFYKNLSYSLLRSIIALFIGFILSYIMAILSYSNIHIRKLFNPLITIMRGIPTIAIILILLIFVPKSAPIIVALLVLIPVMYREVLSSLDIIDKNIVEMANLYKIPMKKRITKIYIPTILKPSLDMIASNINFSFKLIIAAEAIILTRDSIGRMIKNENINLNMENVFALTIICVIVGFVLEYLIKLLTKIIMRYKYDRA